MKRNGAPNTCRITVSLPGMAFRFVKGVGAYRAPLERGGYSHVLRDTATSYHRLVCECLSATGRRKESVGGRGLHRLDRKIPESKVTSASGQGGLPPKSTPVYTLEHT